MRQIVAAEHGKRPGTVGAPAFQRRHDQADGRAWRGRVAEVVADVGVRLIEPAGRRILAIALLGDREADDAAGRLRHRGQHRRRTLGRDQQRAHAADDAGANAGAVALQRGVEPSLRRQAVALVGPLQADAGDPPRARLDREQIVGVGGHMGAHERTQTEMHDADAERAAVVLRQGGAGTCLPERVGRQAGEGGGIDHASDLPVPSVIRRSRAAP